MKHQKRKLLFLLLLFSSLIANAQQDKFSQAVKFLQLGNLDSAKAIIDMAILDSELVNDGQAWYLRGFIYKSIYNASEKSNKQSPSRITALNSFKHSLMIDTTTESIQENKKNIKYLATTLYNDAATNLDSASYKIAINNFNKFKEYYALIDTSSANFIQNDILFLKALASVYSMIYDKNKKNNNEFLMLAKEIYLKVLKLDPNDIGSNLNMGVLFYNQAVQLINQSDYDIDIVALNDIQDNSIKLFREALPFMEKSYNLDPNRRETLLGLSGIYFSLNEKEKSDLFKQKLLELNKK